MNFTSLLTSLLTNLVLTALAYLLFPLILLFFGGGGYASKQAKKIALWNSVIVGTIFFILATAGSPIIKQHVSPALLYYWINSVILTDKRLDPERTNVPKPLMLMNDEGTKQKLLISKQKAKRFGIAALMLFLSGLAILVCYFALDFTDNIWPVCVGTIFLVLSCISLIIFINKWNAYTDLYNGSLVEIDKDTNRND